jgi:hypothetical protein
VYDCVTKSRDAETREITSEVVACMLFELRRMSVYVIFYDEVKGH